MSLSGPKAFQSAIVFEVFANVASLPVIFFKPDLALAYLLEDPSNITPGYRQALFLLGALVVLVTVPLVRAYPSPEPGSAGDPQRTHRVATYITLGASEVVIAALSVSLPRYGIDTGFSKTGLQSVFVSMSAFITLRAFFLFVKPSWMAAKEDTKKRQ